MTQSPNPGSEPNPTPPTPPRSRRRLQRIALPLGIGVLAGLGGVAWWGVKFVNEDLSPLVSQTLTKTLNRPVQVGKVEGFSLTGIRFGPSSLPATATDPTAAKVAAVQVGFNPLQSLLERKVRLDLTLEQPNVYLEQQKDGWYTTKINQEDEQEGAIALDTIRIKDGTVVLLPLGKTLGKRAPITLKSANGKVNVLDKNKRFAYELAAQSTTGGDVQIAGETKLPSQDTKLQVRAKNFQVAEIDRLINLPFELPVGRAGGNLSLELSPNVKNPPINGVAQFENVTMTVPGVPRSFTKASGNLQFRGSQIQLDGVKGNYGKASALANGTVDLDKGFNLTAKVNPITVPDLLDTLKVPLPFAVAGEVVADLKVTGPLETPVLSGVGRSTKPGKIERVALQKYGATFKVDSKAQDIVFQDIQATLTAGGQVSGAGRIDLATKNAAGQIDPTVAIKFVATDIAADAIAQAYNDGKPAPITIGKVNAVAQITGPAANVQTAVQWQAPNGTYPGVGEIKIANGVTTIRNTTFQVEGGTAKVDAVAANGRWQGAAALAAIPLGRFSPDLRGLFSGNFTAAGSLNSFNLADIRAQGNARLSEGIAVIDQPLTAQVQWTGQKLLVQQATAPGFSANGAISARLDGPGAPAIAAFDLNVRLTDFDLQKFGVALPNNIAYSGQADFTGKITGTPTAPKVNGNVALKQFVINGIAFEPYLQGKLQFAQGVKLDLRGQQDRIAAVLDPRFRPIAFEVRRGDALATGRTQSGLLLTELRNIPLQAIAIPGIAAGYSPTGKLNANLEVNLDRQTARGDVAIAQPGIGGYRADDFKGQVSFANGIATLTQGELTRGDTLVQIGAVATLTGANPQAKAQLKVVKGNIQDVLTGLQFFEVEDFQRGTASPIYGTAADLQTVPVDMTQVPIQNQLRRLSEVQKLLALKTAARDASPLPELRDLTGNFNGTINLAASLKSGVSADFNLRGDDFHWGRLPIKQVVAIGQFKNGSLEFLPLRIQSDDMVVAFSGQLLGENQSGQVRVENLPVRTLTDLAALSLNVDGLLNGTATLSGSFDNPSLVGSFNLANGVLNGTSVQQAKGNFTYANARLDFTNTIAVTEKEPLAITGSIPYQLPFAKVAPASDQIALDINVKNEGLALLNVLNNQVAWVDGKGAINLQVRGTLANPIATGTASVENGTIKATALPEPLTHITGVARFDQDRIRVDRLDGTFSQGKVVVAGVIPLARPLAANDRDRDNGLTVTLDKIALNLKGLYQGGVDGVVEVAGTALNPKLGGTIRLSNGQVVLAAAPTPTTQESATVGPDNSPVEFQNLRLELGDRVSLTNPPLLSFVARGELLINGDLNNPQPEGEIRLTSGQVNLFTTQFFLDRGYPQTAVFTKDRGLDPELNVRLVALVPEITSRRIPSTLSPSEILDVPIPATSLGALQTVRVQAYVNGSASRLSDSLQLTSSPPRSEEEIIALIGGSYVDTLGRGDTLLGIANLAGSALLSNIQGTIGRALGLSEFRLFPTFAPNNSNSSDSKTTSTLGLAAEAAVDITPAISVSALKILTNNQPAQFGVRYRINGNLLLRASTDFSGDSRAAVEYELRF